ncbi:putative 6-pyruvoyl-tetrahydropterin synthase [Nitrospira sp. KM1]|uniref:6-carboxytetrahydropterin synthase n=1 Tax=Nitrospira sp. KM1 TaxID=1936990 RepID=UPI0013A7171D|nr:6-carboxytetrahydropterin synthase [Nitrospira sp. KM1]BCA54879.1 putative 6-pyruvoyl-tetrahydropterin synthase [Nitrospira sp. KM1]
MPPVLLTKRIEFAAAHRYFKPDWSEEQNRAAFGRCYNPPAHGHNYMLEVTVSGEVDGETGMVINLFDLKRVLLAVIEEFDHKNFNLDMPYFKDRIPTSENIARVLWAKLAAQKDIGRLHALRLYEDEDLYADVTAATGLEIATVTRRYSFNAISGDQHGLDWDCFVSVEGPIDSVTGMVIDLGGLDQLVHEQVIGMFDGHDLRKVLKRSEVRGEHVAEWMWTALVNRIPSGRLSRIRLVQSRDLAFECAP